MPIYEYKCSSCSTVIEKIQRISDNGITTCPHCLTDTMGRIISSSSFVLKGSGWYETDFKNK